MLSAPLRGEHVFPSVSIRVIRGQHLFHPAEHFFRFLELTFPDGDDFPAEFSEFALMFPIIGNVALEFFVPEGFVGFRSGGVFAAFVPVPETAVNEDNCAVFGQYDVRFARQSLDVFPEAVSGTVQHGADKNFRLRVFSPDSRHVPASLFWSQVIHAQSVKLCRDGRQGASDTESI